MKDGKNNDERTILMSVCQFGNLEIAKLLVEANADPAFVTTHRGEAAIMFAARYGHTDTVKWLLDQQSVSLDDELKAPRWTTLHRAAANGHLETVMALLYHWEQAAHPGTGRGRRASQDSSMLINHANKNNNVTSLMAAASSGWTAITAMLLERGARGGEGLTNSEGKTAVMLASGNGHEQTLRALLLDKACLGGVNTAFDNNGFSALMLAVSSGHTGASRVLLDARADPEIIGEAAGEDSSVLNLVAKNGHVNVCRLLLAYGAKRGLSEAVETAKENEVVRGLLSSAASKRKKAKDAADKARTEMVEARAPADDPALDAARIDEEVRALSFTRQYSGQLVPPRPVPAEIEAKRTEAGNLAVVGGIVLQEGPFRSIWMRVGCVAGVPWHRAWETLKRLVTHLKGAQERAAFAPDPKTGKAKLPCALYVAVSHRSMQSIDFEHLIDAFGFRYHHYRAPGHGAADQDDADLSSAELVYYCWPGPAGTDMVPQYSTSIEGATGLLLSTDGEKVLLVWERGCWSSPGGAVNANETKLEALRREAGEEVSAKVDLAKGATYVGGWSIGGARDQVVNDSFSAFVAHLGSDEFEVDGREVQEARFFEWRPLLAQWRKLKGKADLPKKVPLDLGIASDRNLVNGLCLKWLDRYDLGLGLPCKMTESPFFGEKTQRKVTIG